MIKKKYLAICILLGLLIAIGAYLVQLRNKSQATISTSFKSYILKMDSPNPEKAMAIIRNTLLKEFELCNCLPFGFPRLEKKGIRLSAEECDFIGLPGYLSNTTFGVDVYLLPNNIFSKVKSDTPSIFIGDTTPGRFCDTSPFYGLNTSRREVIERAFSKANIYGHEKYD